MAITRPLLGVALATATLLAPLAEVAAADHGEPPLLQGLPASNISDLYVFRNPSDAMQLVLNINVSPTVFSPGTQPPEPFGDDVRYVFNIDNDGVMDPRDIRADIQIEVTFKDGNPEVEGDVPVSAFFAGPRDDPFIPDMRSNVNALVVVVSLRDVVEDNQPLGVWAHTSTKGLPKKFQEIAANPGRVGAVADALGLGDDFVDTFNQTRIRDQVKRFGAVMELLPDVLVFDPNEPDGFPNGRRLTDVVAGGGSNGPFLDDVPFLNPPNR